MVEVVGESDDDRADLDRPSLERVHAGAVAGDRHQDRGVPQAGQRHDGRRRRGEILENVRPLLREVVRDRRGREPGVECHYLPGATTRFLGNPVAALFSVIAALLGGLAENGFGFGLRQVSAGSLSGRCRLRLRAASRRVHEDRAEHYSGDCWARHGVDYRTAHLKSQMNRRCGARRNGTPEVYFTNVGDDRPVIVPSPRSPSVLTPQQYAAPDNEMPQVYHWPAVMRAN